jgi:predicted ATPase
MEGCRDSEEPIDPILTDAYPAGMIRRVTIERLIAERLSHYQLIRKLGAGGMGEVYLAEDTLLGRKVALKLLPGDFRADDDRIIRLKEEARAISVLNHPNVVIIHELGQHDDLWFIVTEFIEGTTLHDLITQGATLQQVVMVALGVSQALQTIHESGLVHRDVKPENIMLTPHGSVKLVDFGLAFLAAQSASSSDTGMIVGTLPYMSPEQTRGERIDARSDIFSLGATLFELAAGQRPFAGAASHDLIRAIINNPPAINLRFQRLPSELQRLILQMLAKDRAERPAADVLVRRLRAIERLTATPAEAVETAIFPKVEMPLTPTLRRGILHHFPPVATPLLGREDELSLATDLLHQPDVRILTITGPGGSGKSRLAHEIARRVAANFDDVAFVPLDSISDPQLVAAAIAEALGTGEAAGKNVEGRLIDRLADHSTLLVLDNFEQLLEAAAAVASLIVACDGLKLLVTSQARLQLSWEHELPLGPLPVPAPDCSASAAMHNPAVKLFSERARRIDPRFTLSAETALEVAEICRRLDGVPLAIELAASRLKLFTPRAMLERLADPLTLLTGGTRDLPSRHQTMRRTIEWSWSLLDPFEQQLFARLAVFSGGWTLEAVTSVCQLDGEGAIDDLLTSLIEKSLVRQEDLPSGERRYSLLGPLTSFAAEQLAGRPERLALAQRHAAFFTDFAAQADRELAAPSPERALARLELEQANIRAAFASALSAAGDAELALQLARSLLRYWTLRGRYSEGRRLVGSALERTSGRMSELRAGGLYAAAVLADAQGDFDSARRAFDEIHDYRRSTGDQWGIASSINNLAINALRRADLQEARRLGEETLALWRQLGNRGAAALALQNLGNFLKEAGELAAARECYEQSRLEFENLNDRRGVAWSLNLLGDLARRNEPQRARQLLNESLDIFMSLTDHAAVAAAMSDLGDLSRELGDYEEGGSLLQESLLIFRELGDLRSAARVADLIALAAAEREENERAVTLAAAATALRRSIGVPPRAAERQRLTMLLVRARESLGDEKAAAAARAGEELTLGSLVTYVESP